MVFNSNSAFDTENVGALLAKRIEEKKLPRAFVALFGEMGVGKTAFVRGFCNHLGIIGVKSPTYTVVNEYRAKIPVFHFDMYRIETEDDLYSIGFDDYVMARGICISEWSENITDFLPEDAIRVTISRVEDDTEKRIIEIEE